MVRRISEKLKVDTDFIMSEFKTERKEVNIEEIVQEVSIKAKNDRRLKNQNSIEVIIFILISGILGLLASSLIFNIFSESFQNQVPKEELINKN
jgi:cytoskeletal protein RodZ